MQLQLQVSPLFVVWHGTFRSLGWVYGQLQVLHPLFKRLAGLGAANSLDDDFRAWGKGGSEHTPEYHRKFCPLSPPGHRAWADVCHSEHARS